MAGLFHAADRRIRPLQGAADARMVFFTETGGRRLRLEVTPGGFVQANSGINRAIAAFIQALRPLYEGRLVFDLFCGSGNFTLPLSLAASRVVGVEGSSPAARDAARNAAENGLANVRIEHGPVGRVLAALASEGPRPAFCLLDPPRAGSPEAVRKLAELAPPAVVYVSCSPATLVRDLAVLTAGGYRVAHAGMADMFPQTAHAEGVVLLLRDGVELPPL
jgi:23S rRNA (uracil1939-C5)-methyltransferase